MSADLQRIIRIVFQGDNQTQKAFGELSSSLDMVEDGIRSVTGPMAALADDILKAQAAAVTLATGGMVLMVQQAGSWSDAFNEISTLLDVTGDGLNQFRTDVLGYASTSTASLEDINAALYTAISAGVDYSESLGLIAQSEQLATAGKADLESTTRLLASTMNAYGAGMDEAGRYADVFFQTVKLGQTTLPELAESLSSVTSIAAAAGIPIETVAAAIATLTAKGMPTTEAMTAIRGAISAIITPTSEAAAMAESLGIEFGASALQANGLEGVLLDVYNATGGNVEQIAALFGNVRGLTGVLAAFGSDGGNAFLANLEQMQNSTGSVETAFEKMKDNVGQSTQTLINQMRTTLIQAGLPLLDQFGDAAGALGSIFEGLRIGIDQGAFDPLYASFDALMARMIKFGNEVAAALPDALEGVDWTPLLNGLRELDDALSGIFRALFQDLDPTKPEDLNQIIQTMINLFGQLGTTSAGIIDQWRPLADLTGRLSQSMGEMDPRVAAVAGQLLGAAQKAEFLWDRLGFLKGTLVLVGSETTATGENITALGIAFNALLNPVQAVRQLLEVLFPSLRQSGEEMTEAATGADDLGEKTGFLERVISGLPGPLGAIVNGLNLFVREAQAAEGEVAELNTALEQIPEETTAHINFDWDAFNDWDEEFWAKVDKEKEIQIKTRLDDVKVRDDMQIVKNIIDETGKQIVVIEPKMDEPSIEATEKTIDQLLKEREIEIQFDIAKLQANADVVQTAIEWKAQVDIANAQADMERFKAAAESITATIASTGELIGDMFAQLGGLQKGDDLFWQIQNQLQEENRMRREAFELQKELTQEQLASMRARREAMERGDAMITINGEGLQPHLEAFMWEILGAIQTRVNEEGLDMLMGTEPAGATP